MDGKTLRGTIEQYPEPGQRLLAAYLPCEGVVLMQVGVASQENGIIVAPHLLHRLDLRGKVVVGDALHTQRALLAQIIASGGHYLWTVRDNQAQLKDDIAVAYEAEPRISGFSPQQWEMPTTTTMNKGHGRLEERTITVSDELKDHLDWSGVARVFKIERRFVQLKSQQIQEGLVYGLTSLPVECASPERLSAINRSYWGVENGPHSRRDATFNEDRCWLRLDHAAHIMAALNNLAVGLKLQSGFKYAPEARRRYCARPLEALRLILAAP